MGGCIVVIVIYSWQYVNRVREFGFDAHHTKYYFILVFLISFITTIAIYTNRTRKQKGGRNGQEEKEETKKGNGTLKK